MARRTAILGTMVAGVAVVALATLGSTSTTAQVSRSVVVTVQSASGTPVVNALVCIGTASDRAALGGVRTNASGNATMTIPAETTASLLLTGSLAGAGSEARLPARLSLVMLRLPATGGPACPATTQQPAVPGQITISRAAIDRAIAAEAARPPIARIGSINLGKPCFGAAGQNCGKWTVNKIELSTCNPLTHTCNINAGSWQHDECCVRNPQGAMCDDNLNELVNSGQVCQAEFELAVKRLPTPLTWTRFVDFEARNTTGIVDHAAYCAPIGTPVDGPAGEERFCCSRRAVVPGPDVLTQLADRLRTQIPVARIRICT